MDEAGIDAAVVMTITDWPEVNAQSIELVAEACAAHPGRLYGFARVHPWYGDEAIAALERAIIVHGFKGVEAPRDDDRAPGRSRDAALDQNGRRARRSDALPLWRRALDNAAGIAQAARECPEATIILGHMGVTSTSTRPSRWQIAFPTSFSRHPQCPIPRRSARRSPRRG